MNTWRGPSAVTASTADASPASATAFGVFRLVSARLESISFLSFLGSPRDRKSTRLNSSHSQISYAVFCLKKKQFNPDGLRVATCSWDNTARLSASHTRNALTQPLRHREVVQPVYFSAESGQLLPASKRRT